MSFGGFGNTTSGFSGFTGFGANSGSSTLTGSTTTGSLSSSNTGTTDSTLNATSSATTGSLSSSTTNNNLFGMGGSNLNLSNTFTPPKSGFSLNLSSNAGTSQAQETLAPSFQFNSGQLTNKPQQQQFSLLGNTSQQQSQLQPQSQQPSNPLLMSSQVTNNLSNNSITFRVLEDYINKWMSDLDDQEKDFISQATQLNALDKLMIANGEKLVDVSSEVDRLNNEQQQLEQELNFILSQQNDLEVAIKKFETGIDDNNYDNTNSNINYNNGDTTRIEMYKMLIEVDNQLRSMSSDMRDIIRRLNETKVNVNDPTMQISKILNTHMDSLNWIEDNTNLIQNHVDKLTKEVDYRSNENEKNSFKLFSI
jgi:nuclear pore complex protein Nup62